MSSRSLLSVTLAVTLACTQPERSAPTSGAVAVERPNFLVLLPDSLRADRVMAQRDGQPLAPTLAALAGQGARFDDATSQAGWTMPSLAALLTGRYPVLPRGDGSMLGWIGPDRRTFPGVLSLYGYHTVGFLGANAAVLAGEFGAAFDGTVQASGDNTVPGVSANLVDWLAHEPPEPFLAVVHDIDLQFVATASDLASIPGAAERHRAMSGNRQDREAIAMGELQRLLEPLLPRDEAHQRIEAAYDDTVARYDRSLGQVLAALDEAGLRQRTVIVLSSPHGHQLGEKGRFEHGSMTQPDLQVPLLWVDPSLPRSNQTVEPTVQGIDLAPSILARAGADPDVGMAGRSFLPLLALADGSYEPSDVFALNNPRDMALRSGDLTLIHFLGGRTRAQPRESAFLLYDLAVDPGQRKDLWQNNPPAEAQAMRTRLVAFREERLAESEALASDEPAPGQDALRQRLQRDGYWHHVEPERGEP